MSSGSLRKSRRKKTSSIKAKMLNERGCDIEGRQKKMATDWDVFFKEILLDDTQTRSENNGTPTKSDNYQQDLNDTLRVNRDDDSC
jgi:hypothetical protein